jgi:hypothetical protein
MTEPADSSDIPLQRLFNEQRQGRRLFAHVDRSHAHKHRLMRIMQAA